LRKKITIGILAHVDAGKTTLSEALLYLSGKIRTLGRSAEVFFAAVMGILVLVIAFALVRVKMENLFPVSKLDAVPVLRAGGLVTDVVATSVSGFFLRGNVRRKSPAFQTVLRWLCLNTVIVVLLLVVTIGTYGAALTWRMQQPFFAVVRDMRIFDVFERIEAVVMAIWVITDFMLITLHLFYCSEILRVCTGAKQRKWFVPPTAAAALIASLLMAKNAFDLWLITEKLVRLIVPVVSFVVLPLSLVGVKAISKKQKKMKKVLDKGGEGGVYWASSLVRRHRK